MVSSTKKRTSDIYLDTELVYINSSRPRLDGPAARVIRRKDNRYMLPRSPRSPTLHGQSTSEALISGSIAARSKNDFILTEGKECQCSHLFFVKLSTFQLILT